MEETAYTKYLVDQASAYITREHTASVFLLKDWMGGGGSNKLSGIWHA